MNHYFSNNNIENKKLLTKIKFVNKEEQKKKKSIF